MPEPDQRTPAFPILPLLTRRWSPRAFDGSALEETALLTLLEAARWAPSAYNAQPWRFVYALRGSAGWEPLLGALVPFNRSWAQAASALVFLASDRFSRDAAGVPQGEAPSHSFDAGAAWAQLALQATHDGLHAHAMTGFDPERARAAMALPAAYRIEAAVAIGRIADRETLPEPLRARERPSMRRPLGQLAFEGRFQD